MITAAEIVEKKGKDIISVGINCTVEEALKIMIQYKIGAILVKEGENFVGVWTERDLMKNSTQPDFNPKTAKLVDYMTTKLISSPHTDSIYQLMDKCLGMRLRHLLIEKEGKYIGFLSTGDISKANLIEKSKELEELKVMVNWDYYEDWKWKKKQ